MKTITLLASGTRGDVQPYLALGIGLRQAGFNPRIATHENFAPMVASVGLEFVQLADNPSDLFARPGGEYALRFDLQHPLRNMRATLAYWRDAQPAFARLIKSARDAAQNSDALIFGLPTLWGMHIAHALNIPAIRCMLQPNTPTREFPSPLLPFRFSFGATYNRLTYRVVEQSMRLAWRSALERQHPSTLLRLPQDTLTLYGFSAHIVARPSDWTSSEQITGYWFMPTSSTWRPSAELEKFLSAGAPPVYIGFGSLHVRDPQTTLVLITSVLQQINARAVLAVARDFSDARLPENIFPVVDVPHAWLFSQMSAAVHHGGAGTTAACLRAGVPTIIIPLAVDQFFWGERIAQLGVGAQPIPQRTLTVDSLARALQSTRDTGMKARAVQLAAKIFGEDGVARAVDFIRALV